MSEYSNRPGSALASLIPDWAVQFKKGCGCKDMQKKMDRWGTQGCKSPGNYESIVAHLIKQSDLLVPMLRGLPKSVRRMGAKRLLDKAIVISEKA